MTRIVAPADFGGPEQLHLTETDTPQPGAGEVRVAVRAIGVNPVDWKFYSGMMGRDPQLLSAAGIEASGVVEAVGDGVEDWSVGDQVIVNSIPTAGYADALVVPVSALFAKPEGLDFETAATVPVAGGTAAHALEVVDAKDGDVVLVHGGAGGVGSLAVQLARRRGARVIATASEANHDYLRDLGAEPVAYGDGLVDRVQALAPQGVDAAIDTVGSDEALDTSVALVQDRQRIVTIAGFQRAGELGIVAIGGGDEAERAIRTAAQPHVAALLATGDLTQPIAGTYPLEETAQAHRDSKAGHTRGKLVVVP